MRPILQIAGCDFPTQKSLGDHLNTIRNAPDDEFEARVTSPEIRTILDAMITTRVSKVEELRGRQVVGWTRKKRGRNWAFYAELCDGSFLDMGVSASDISEFWHAWLAREAEAVGRRP